MKKTWICLLLLALPLVAGAQSTTKDFVKGADVGFLTGQERRGVKFHDRNGQERECLELLKNDYQMSAIRMRVWVNPRGGLPLCRLVGRPRQTTHPRCMAGTLV